MKKAVLFGFLFFSILSFNLTAQENQLFQLTSVRFNNVFLDSALHILEDKIGLNFTYNSEFTNSQKTINSEFNSFPLSIILDSLFNNPCLNYKIVNEQYSKYNFDFWGNNNFILPEEDLIKALERFEKEELEIGD